MTRKKAPKYQDVPPKVSDLNKAKVLIDELWEQLRYYEDKLTTSSKNSSKSPSSDSPKDRHERKKDESSGGRNSRGAKEGHTGHQRKLSPLKKTDVIINCFPELVLVALNLTLRSKVGHTISIRSSIFQNPLSISPNTV